MQPTTLILLGKGETRRSLAQYRADFPGSVLWTMNDFVPPNAGEGALAALLRVETARHFDIHHPSTLNLWDQIADLACPVTISPFVTSELRGPLWQPFPLDAVFATFGCALLESTCDYMLALAALRHRQGVQILQRVCLPGFDFTDRGHFALRFGAHYWLGVLAGMGVKLLIPRECALLKRGEREGFTYEPSAEGPHAYGQPGEITAPLASRYGWKEAA